MAELFFRHGLHCNVVCEVDGHVNVDEEVLQVVGGGHVLLGGIPGKGGAEGNVDATGYRDENQE